MGQYWITSKDEKRGIELRNGLGNMGLKLIFLIQWLYFFMSMKMGWWSGEVGSIVKTCGAFEETPLYFVCILMGKGVSEN